MPLAWLRSDVQRRNDAVSAYRFDVCRDGKRFQLYRRVMPGWPCGNIRDIMAPGKKPRDRGTP
jgi:hypothetical protein